MSEVSLPTTLDLGKIAGVVQDKEVQEAREESRAELLEIRKEASAFKELYDAIVAKASELGVSVDKFFEAVNTLLPILGDIFKAMKDGIAVKLPAETLEHFKTCCNASAQQIYNSNEQRTKAQMDRIESKGDTVCEDIRREKEKQVAQFKTDAANAKKEALKEFDEKMAVLLNTIKDTQQTTTIPSCIFWCMAGVILILSCFAVAVSVANYSNWHHTDLFWMTGSFGLLLVIVIGYTIYEYKQRPKPRKHF